MRSMSPVVRVFAGLAVCSAFLSPGMPTRAGASQFDSLPPQDPPPSIPVFTSDQTVYPTTITAPLGQLDGLAPRLAPGSLPNTLEPSFDSGIELLSMPATAMNFDGLFKPDYSIANPPHLDGAVSPFHYVQVVDGHIGVFDKSNGALLDDMTFDELWQVAPGTTRNDACITPLGESSFHRGAPGVLFDHLNEHWIISDVAVDNYLTGPFYLCIYVSEGLVPLGGTLIRYAINVDDPWLPDSPEFAIWNDGLYVAADMYDCTGANCAPSTYQGARVWAFNVSKMYFGSPLAPEDIQYSDLGTGFHDLLPSNILGVPPVAGTPNYLVAQISTTSLDVWKFDVDWSTPANSTFSAPTQVDIAAYSAPPSVVPQKAADGGEDLHAHGERLMPHNQYRKIGVDESLWLTHTVGNGGTPNVAGLRWYQLDVTGGTIDTTPAQYGDFFGGPPADGTYRWIPSLAVDTDGGMAIGYSASSTLLNPEIRYAGRLAGDPAGALTQGEANVVSLTGAQDGANNTWGPHSSMAIDPADDCTFWYSNMYYVPADPLTADWYTRIASFKYPGCLINDATISGNTGLPNVTLSYNSGGPKTVVSDANGNYSFEVPYGWSGEVTPELPHYYFSPGFRQYVSILAHAFGQDYTPLPYVRYAPTNEQTVCRTPYIVVRLQLSDLTRNAAGNFNLSTVTFTLDTFNILGLSFISVPQTSPQVWAHFSFQPSSPLPAGPHTVQFTHPEASGTMTDTWTFTAADMACSAPPLSAPTDDAQVLQSPATFIPGQPLTGSQLRRLSPGSLVEAPAMPPLTESAAGQDFSPLVPQSGALQPLPASVADPMRPELSGSPALMPAIPRSPFGFGPLRLPLHPGWVLLYYLKAR